MNKAQATIDKDHLDEFRKARKAASEAYENFLEAQQHLRAAAKAVGLSVKEHAWEQFEESGEYVRRKTDDVIKESEDYIRSNPVSSAGIAFLGGFLLSRLMSR